MRKNLLNKGLIGLILLIGTLSCQKDKLSTAPLKLEVSKTSLKTSLNSSSTYWNYAQLTHNFVVGNILTSYNSYRQDTSANMAVCWYSGSQIDADALFAANGDSRYLTYMNNAYTWMGNMWDINSSIGGYFSHANINGTGAGGYKYDDDAGIMALAYLDAYNVTTGTTQTNYLNSAEAIANWYMNNGLWDSAQGGGFYWNSSGSSNGIVRATEVNGLIMQVFIRLYGITNQTYYKTWANSVRTWIESNLFNSTTGLYQWEIDGSGTLQNVYFTYDNAIMVKADLLYAQTMGDTSYYTKAENLGTAMISPSVLWNSTYNVFIFNTDVGIIVPVYSAWGSEAMIDLYKYDGNANWLNYAQENIDCINSKLRNTTNGGYYHSCNFNGSGLTTNDYEGVDQAWMQREQTLLSNYR